LCCNGVIFADVELQSGDNAARLEAAGLPLSGLKGLASGGSKPRSSRKLKFPQPCAAFDGCRCRIYSERPVYCRGFECLLLGNVLEGRTQMSTALKTVQAARDRADIVRRLLRELGDTEESLALNTRFRRTAKKMEDSVLDSTTAEKYGELTLAVHDLNLILSESFYPGP
jgi:Fe-S-cluster containining protein